MSGPVLRMRYSELENGACFHFGVEYEWYIKINEEKSQNMHGDVEWLFCPDMYVRRYDGCDLHGKPLPKFYRRKKEEKKMVLVTVQVTRIVTETREYEVEVSANWEEDRIEEKVQGQIERMIETGKLKGKVVESDTIIEDISLEGMETL